MKTALIILATVIGVLLLMLVYFGAQVLLAFWRGLNNG